MTQVYGLGTDFSIVIIQLDWIIQRSSKWGQISTLNKTIQIMLVHEFRLMLVQCRDLTPDGTQNSLEDSLQIFLILIVIVISHSIDAAVDICRVEEYCCPKTDIGFDIFILLMVVV